MVPSHDPDLWAWSQTVPEGVIETWTKRWGEAGRETIWALIWSGGPPTSWEKILGLIGHLMANDQLIFMLADCHMNLLSP